MKTRRNNRQKTKEKAAMFTNEDDTGKVNACVDEIKHTNDIISDILHQKRKYACSRKINKK